MSTAWLIGLQPGLSLLLGGLATVAALALALPGVSLLVLTLAARRATRTLSPGPEGAHPRPRLAVLVPAHDESAHLRPTLQALLAQCAPGDRVLVVADNCSDDTAAQARAAGAEVVERCDPARRGKGHALAFGVDHLRADPPEVVMVVDADCLAGDGALATVARACGASGRPVQLLNLMHAPAGAPLRVRVLEFAMRLKNLVRPLGTMQLGGVCHLTGTGMALPWPLMARAELATGHLAEDMKLGVQLTCAGQAPMLLTGARIASPFVTDAGTGRRQKARWEHGSLDTLREELPGLLALAWRRRSRCLAALAMDLMVPPIALALAMLVPLTALAGLGAAAWPALLPAAVLLGLGLLAMAAAVLLAWWWHGRDLLRGHELLRLPAYVLWKLPVYLAYVAGRRMAWLRTRREAGADAPQPAGRSMR